MNAHWLDPIIAQQAAHYGLSVPQFERLMNSAATVQEEIEASGDDFPQPQE
ncbi:hypothetical protein [Paraburkholderia youngii]|uniref:hypothetical protein n=1 Tax=Paraburkholderia youngii TaxID=2782701 RepID=UPI0015922F1E|nr:hypothetical protein [Paraburkholderia youngii]